MVARVVVSSSPPPPSQHHRACPARPNAPASAAAAPPTLSSSPPSQHHRARPIWTSAPASAAARLHTCAGRLRRGCEPRLPLPRVQHTGIRQRRTRHRRGLRKCGGKCGLCEHAFTWRVVPKGVYSPVSTSCAANSLQTPQFLHCLFTLHITSTPSHNIHTLCCTDQLP